MPFDPRAAILNSRGNFSWLRKLYDASAKMMIMGFCPDWSISGPHCATWQIIKFVDVDGRYATNFATIMRDLITLITRDYDYTKYPEGLLVFAQLNYQMFVL
jgi:hypothetical protein